MVAKALKVRLAIRATMVPKAILANLVKELPSL
jgi:hypothetical protein